MFNLLLRNAARRNQCCIALQVQFCVAQLRLVTEQLGLHLLELSLKWAGVDLDQQVPLLDVLPLLKVHLHDLPIDPTLDVGSVEGRDRAQAGQVNRHVLPLHLCGRHGDGVRPGSLRLLLLGVRAAAAGNEKRA